MGDLSGVERHKNLEEKFVIQLWSFPPLNVMLRVVCFSSLIIPGLRKYWDGNIIKEFTLKMVRPRKNMECHSNQWYNSSEDTCKARLIV